MLKILSGSHVEALIFKKIFLGRGMGPTPSPCLVWHASDASVHWSLFQIANLTMESSNSKLLHTVDLQGLATGPCENAWYISSNVWLITYVTVPFQNS